MVCGVAWQGVAVPAIVRRGCFAAESHTCCKHCCVRALRRRRMTSSLRASCATGTIAAALYLTARCRRRSCAAATACSPIDSVRVVVWMAASSAGDDGGLRWRVVAVAFVCSCDLRRVTWRAAPARLAAASLRVAALSYVYTTLVWPFALALRREPRAVERRAVHCDGAACVVGWRRFRPLSPAQPCSDCKE